MFDFKFRPKTYFEEDISSALLVKLHYPESQWGEQISIYAHQSGYHIQLEAVDFYGHEYMLYPSKIEEPLSLEDLIDLIEGMKLNRDELDGKMELVLDGIPEAKSNYYPELEKYYSEKRKDFGLD
ncbi:UDP-glucuronosyltransferase [Algoriphagus sp. CAU 1675]|uniref:UDP-glucuronosyltransferase n=1 Tax=Algoriphagus sp. CAU 1675 TaxID=3032597 RepID=UPI0023DB9437|nr:UDP-glucuronosyltransferase [Algoriphagus sp. CAU 1675]MDF2156299.1 UDP-glucuronosyltransferase [Algoriphagus sp. CAU 1675]